MRLAQTPPAHMAVERFVTRVEQCLGGGAPPGQLATDEAARTTHAVLAALALRLSPRDRRCLAAELPEPLAAELDRIEIDDGPPAADTVGRVARELGIDRAIAARRVACVLCTLHETVRPAVRSALPADLDALAT
ncbi:MAG: DUF2267 domain-containing protein [Polyangia bacterium]